VHSTGRNGIIATLDPGRNRIKGKPPSRPQRDSQTTHGAPNNGLICSLEILTAQQIAISQLTDTRCLSIQ